MFTTRVANVTKIALQRALRSTPVRQTIQAVFNTRDRMVLNYLYKGNEMSLAHMKKIAGLSTPKSLAIGRNATVSYNMMRGIQALAGGIVTESNMLRTKGADISASVAVGTFKTYGTTLLITNRALNPIIGMY